MSLVLPNVVQAFIDSRTGNPHPSYRRWMEDVTTALNGASTVADLAELIARLGSTDGTIAGIPEPSDLQLVQGVGIAITGGDTIGLRPVDNSGAGALLGITRDGYGRVLGTTDATITAGPGSVAVTNGDAVAGPPTLALVNDEATPAASTYYGTDGSGAKGFHALPAAGGSSGGEILIQDGSSAPPVMLTNEAEDDFLYSD